VDIKKIDIKKKLAAGTALAVLSGFVPPVMNHAQAGTATVPVTIQIVTAVSLTNTSALNFGRLAITGLATGNNHTLSPGGVTTTAVGMSVALAGTPGAFDITAGSLAANVNVLYTNNVTYAGGNINLNQITVGGPAMVAPVAVAASGTATGNLVGGGNTDVQVGGRLNFVANPANGNYNGNSAVIQIVDIP